MSRRPLTAVGCILEKYAGDALPAVMPVVACEVFAAFSSPSNSSARSSTVARPTAPARWKWDEPHAGYGFPLPLSQRNRYEGRDRLL